MRVWLWKNSTETDVTQHAGLPDQVSQSGSPAGTCRMLRYECIHIIYRIENRLDVWQTGTGKRNHTANVKPRIRVISRLLIVVGVPRTRLAGSPNVKEYLMSSHKASHMLSSSSLTYWVSKILVPHKSRKREAMWIDSQSLILRRVLDRPRPPNPLRCGGGRFGLTIPTRDRQARPATFASTASCIFSGPDFNDSQSGGTRTQRMESWRTVVHQL